MKTTFIAFATLFATSAFAGSSASANYATTTEVLDAGGRTVTSANYATDVSIGAIGSIGSTASYVNRGGFAGQLYELANSISLAASAPSLVEGDSVALSARRVLSDGTLLAIFPTSVAWSVQSGPLASISVGGLALAGVVYEDTPAVVQGTYLGMSATVSLTVLDQNPDNYGTYAGDGLPDFWQFTHFGLNNANAAPTVDADGDGQNNRLEYLATTTPTDPNSRLLLRIELVPAKPDWRRIVFEPYSTKRTYTLHSSDNLANPLAWQPLKPGDEGQDGAAFFFMDDKATEPAKFYRIEISE